MGVISALTHHFAQGEVSKAALARVDMERLRLAAEIQENLFPHVIGKGQVRPGTKYIGTTASNAKARLLKFVRSPTDTALIECTSALARFMVDDTLVTRPSVTSTVDNGAFSTASATITMTIASPGVVTWTSHGFVGGEKVVFTTTGALPTGVTAGTTYYVLSTSITANTFRFSTTSGGSAVNTSGTQSGTHTGNHGWAITATSGSTGSVSSGSLTIAASARGSSVTVSQFVSTSNTDTEHALRITITQGEMLFRCGSTSGGAEYIAETTIGEGVHSLAFTPTASPYYITFITRKDLPTVIDSCTVESSGVMTLPAPWSEADLPLIRADQSIDVMFLACQSWGPRKIERRNSGRSWSITKYLPTDGPFVTADTNNISITPGAAYGSTTLTASANLFTSSHVGSLIKLSTSGYSATFNLAGSDTWTEAIRVYGSVDADTYFTSTVSGTWVGTLRVQRSYDGPTSGFIDVSSGSPWELTGNGTFSYTGQSILNAAIWYRIGFKPAAYTSGVATITLTYNGGGGYGVYRITAYSSATSVTAVATEYPTSLNATKNWSFGAWSDAQQYPSAVGFYEGRLWFGGADKLWGSESDDYYAFNLDDEGSAGSIQRAVATGGSVNRILWILPLQRLILGSSGAEISLRSSSFDEPLTPTNISLKDAATHGVSSVSPVKMDSRGFYVHRDGIRLFEVIYDVEVNDYRVNSVMLFNDTIGGDGFEEIAVQRSPESYIWTVRADGQCPIMIYDPKEKTAGWIRFIAAASAAGDAVVESVAVLPSSGPDRVYLVVKRTINGSTTRYIEKLAMHSEAQGGTTNHMADSYVYTAGPITTVTGLTHLVGETVVAWGTTGGVTGPIGTTYTVNGSGEITLPSSSTGVTVGLKYNWRYQSAKLAYGTKGGTALLMPKKVGTIGMLLANAHPNSIRYGPSFTKTYAMPRVEGGQVVSETTVRTTYDEKSFSFSGDWDTDSRVCLKGEAPYPAEILALVIGEEINED